MPEKTLLLAPGRTAEMSRLRQVGGAALLCTVLVVFCYVFVDRRVEYFVAGHRGFQLGFEAMASPSILPTVLAGLYLPGYCLARTAGWRPGRRAELLLLLAIAVVSVTALKDELKWVFGRPWPDSWTHFNVYRFHPCNGDDLFGSFPSGHTAVTAAPLCVLWFQVPRYRVLWAGIILMVMTGLVGGGYHFVGDTIAGLFLGLATALGTLVVMPQTALRTRW